MDTQEAIAHTIGWVRSLAELPPPSPKEKDDIGFSGVTNRPLRNYLAQIELAGADGVPLEAHFAAVSYLRAHSKSQIGRAAWEEAFTALRDAWHGKLVKIDARQGARATEAAKEFGKTVAKDSEEGAEEAAEVRAEAAAGVDSPSPEERAARVFLRTQGTEAQGTAGRDGSWEREPDGWISIQTPRRTKYGLSTAVLEKAGLKNRNDFRWNITRGPSGDVFKLQFHPKGIGRAADLLQAGWPLLAAALRAYLPVWEEKIGWGEAQKAEAAVESWTGNEASGKSYGGVRWEWAKEDPDTLLLLLPKDLAFALDTPATGVKRGQYPNVEYWRAYRTEELDTLIAELGSVGLASKLGTGSHLLKSAGVVAQVLTHFRTVWMARPEVDDTALKRARNLVRRFKYMVHPDVRNNESKLETTLAKVAPLLQRVKPGDTSCDLGSYGRWTIVKEAGEMDLTEKSSLRIYMPYQLKDWAEGARSTGKKKDLQGQWYDGFLLKRAPEVARRLDLVSPPLALSLRIALLTEVLRECYELEEMAGAISLADIADGAVRAQAQGILDKVYPHLAPKMKLYPFQEVGVAFAALTGYRALIADNMGLGKTPQALGALVSDLSRLTPALVVAPASVTYNWVKEAAKWTPALRVRVIDSSSPLGRLREGDVLVLSAGSVANLHERLEQANFKTLVLDESHLFKNPKAARTKAVMELSKLIPHRLLLSGTAMENRPEELWAQLHMVAPEVFPDFKEFKAKFATTTKRKVGKITYADDRGGSLDGDDGDDGSGSDEFGQDTDGPDSPRGGGAGSPLVLAELRETLRCFMVRRLKQEVLKDLPPKTRDYLWIPLPGPVQQAYDRVVAEMEDWLCRLWRSRAVPKAALLVQEGLTLPAAVEQVNAEGAKVAGNSAGALVALGHLRRIVGEAKAALAVDWIQEWVEGGGGPLICFVEHQKVLRTVQQGLTKAGITWTVIDGSVSAKARSQRVDEFQAGKYQVFLGTQAMHAGVTLTRASDVLFVERWWVPSKEEQAEDRAHRIGQKSATNVRYIMAPNTIDTHIAELVDAKRELIEAVLRGEAIEEQDTRGTAQRVDASLFSAILQKMVVEKGGCKITAMQVQAYLNGDQSVVTPPQVDTSWTDTEDGAVELEGAGGREAPISPIPPGPPAAPAAIYHEFQAWLSGVDSEAAALLGTAAGWEAFQALFRGPPPDPSTPARMRTVGRAQPGETADPYERYHRVAEAIRKAWATMDPHGYGLDEAEVKRLMRQLGLTLIGAGTQRVVIDAGDGRVLKVGAGTQNRVEAAVWDAAPPEIRALLVPVRAISADGSWLLMDYARPWKEGDPRTAWDGYDKLTRFGIQDIVQDNLARDGRVLDYGMAKLPPS